MIFRKSWLGWFQTHISNFVICERKLTRLFRVAREGLPSIKRFPDLQYLDPFRRYLRSTSEVVQNRPKCCIFLAPTEFWNQLLIMCQSFTAIVPVSTEILHRKKITSAVKRKTVGNYRSGRPNNKKLHKGTNTNHNISEVTKVHTSIWSSPSSTTRLRIVTIICTIVTIAATTT